MSLYLNEGDYDWDDEYPRKKSKSKAKYVVCESCERPLFDYVYLCPFCKGYRFSGDSARVKVALEKFKANFREMLDQEIWY